MKRIILFTLGLILVFLVVSLRPVQQFADDVISFVEYGSAKSDCERKGGYWDVGMRLGCYIPLKDLGKVCNQKSDCERDCLFTQESRDAEGYLTGVCGEDSLDTCDREQLFPSHKIKKSSELVPGIEGCA
jgi:hypothetical protein